MQYENIFPEGTFSRDKIPEGGLFTKHKITKIVPVAILCTLVLGFVLYSILCIHTNNKHAALSGTGYHEAIAKASDSALLEAKAFAISYNDLIAVASSEDPYVQAVLQEAKVEYEELLNLPGNGTMGYVEIPKLCINLPIYLDTVKDSKEPGVEHLLGTSLPVGGESTHSVLTVLNNPEKRSEFFEPERLFTGDVFYLHVLGETLAYQIDSIATVPDPSGFPGITTGEDHCTLATLAPNDKKGHQLLIRGTRISNEEAQAIAADLGLK